MHGLELLRAAVAGATDVQFAKLLLQERNTLKHHRSITQLLQTCMVNRKPYAAWWVLQAAGKNVTAAHYLELASYSHSLKEAKERTEGFKLDRQVAFSLLKACKNDIDPVGAATVAEEMTSAGIPLEGMHYAAIIASQRCFTEATKYYSLARENDNTAVWIFISYISYCARHVSTPRDQYVKAAESAWDTMSSLNLLKIRPVWKAMRRVYENSGDEVALSAFNNLIKSSKSNLKAAAIEPSNPFVLKRYG